MATNKGPYSAIFGLLKQAGITEDDERRAMIKEVTRGRTDSLKALTAAENERLYKHLRNAVGANKHSPKMVSKVQRTEAWRKRRAYIIHLLALNGWMAGANPDYDRINDFIRHIGSNNPRKVILNFLDEKEMAAVCAQVEALYKNEMNRAIKQDK